jgi:Ca2+:H+ antiporter
LFKRHGTATTFFPSKTDEEAHAPPPAARTVAVSAALLLVSLVAVVGLAKVLTPTVEFAVTRLAVPKAVAVS